MLFLYLCFFIKKKFLSEFQGDVDKANKNKNFDQRADDSGKGFSRVNPEYCNSNCNSQLEIIAGCCE